MSWEATAGPPLTDCESWPVASPGTNACDDDVVVFVPSCSNLGKFGEEEIFVLGWENGDAWFFN